jgi:hypothetical protein
MCVALLSCYVLLLSAGLPADLQKRFLREVESLRKTHYVAEDHYEAVVQGIREARDVEATRQVLKLLVQLMFDHDRGNDWVAALAAELESAHLRPLEFDVVPEHLEVERVVLKDGRELLGTGGSLIRYFPHHNIKKDGDHRYLHPNLGLHGLGSFWIAGRDVRRSERASVASPRAFLRASYRTVLNAAGHLEIDGLWFFPRVGNQRRTIVLEGRSSGEGGTLFVNEEYALQCVRRPEALNPQVTYYEEDPNLAGESEWARDPEVRRLLERVEELRSRSVASEWWQPFNPPGQRLQEVARRADLIDEDAAASLLRLRFALVYGEQLPALALERPFWMAQLERRVLTALASGGTTSVDRATQDWRAVAAAIRRAPSPQEPPDPGLQGEHYVAFPRNYSPWRRWPLLVALHGQGCQPSNDFQVWREQADAAGMILLCPRYGSRRGAPRNLETDRTILDLVRYYVLRFNVDADRIYLTGMSMGGATSWNLAQTYPSRWAAVAPEIHAPAVINEGFPRLRNLAQLPLFLLEGEFDGYNTVYSRNAVQLLQRWRAPVQYYEAQWFGHSRLYWKYPEILDFFANCSRDSHPVEVEHRSYHAHAGEASWLAIRDVDRPGAWDRTDGAFALGDLTGVQATYEKGVVKVREVEGDVRAVEIYFDDQLMASPVKIQWAGKSQTWTPAPSVQRMLHRARFLGEREQVYGDSIRLEF